MASSGMLRRVALVRTDVSEEFIAPFLRVTRIGELGTALTVTGNDIRCEEIGISSQRAFTDYCHPDERGAKSLRNVGSYKNDTA
jgi:hypothetical protein